MNFASKSLPNLLALGAIVLLGSIWNPALARDEVCVYDERNWRGDRFCTSESIRYLDDEGWNDDIASIEVERGLEVILYEDFDFQGPSLRVYHDEDHIGHGLDHKVSSLKIVRSGDDDHHRSRGDDSHSRYSSSDGWELQQFCNCKTHKRCYVKHSGSGREVGECLFDCPHGCKE